MGSNGISLATERELAENIGRFAYDMYGFIMFAYPWGVKGTSLEKKDGPEEWQRELADAISAHMRENADRREIDLDMIPWRSVRASGHGTGKSAFVAWICQFIMSVRPWTRGVVTANTGTQLETKTWPELAKWHAMLINKHWFQWTAQSYYFALCPEDQRKNYMLNATTVSPENTEAFAGLHNEQSAVVIIMDEMSGIDERVVSVAQGALTDGEAFFLGFGNPTQPAGPFFDCFHKHSKLYNIGYIDSRSVRHTNKVALQQTIDLFGADSDEVKYRVYGQFPTRSYNGFISAAKVDEAMQRELFADPGAALILGVDVSRYGDDETVLCPRRGRDARSLPWQVFKGLDGVAVADRVAQWADMYKPDLIVIESVGPGVGVIDILRGRKFKVHDLHPGAPSAIKGHRNRRMDIWADGRTAIENGLCLPTNDVQLYTELTNINYGITTETQQMFMEAKKDMKARGQSSPDRADALMLTYATTVARRDAQVRGQKDPRAMAIIDYDEFAL